ncbi:MAG TPA: hypothetical protein VGF59_10165 [Bryobacteraceae bacterium]|jgi:hypothetical protein
MHPQRTGPNTPEGKAQRPLAAALEEAGTQWTCRGEQVRFARSGKAASSRNAIKHGLTSRHVVLPGENRGEFDALVARLVDEHRAKHTLEIEIIHEIAGCMWRLDRARKAESEYFYINFIADKATKDTERRFALILRYTGAIERELHRAITRLQQLSKERTKLQQNKLTTDNRQLTTEFVSQLTTDHRPPTTDPSNAPLQLATSHQPLATQIE